MGRSEGQAVCLRIHHSPILKLDGLGERGELEVDSGTTVETLLGVLGIREDQRRYLLVYANGEKQRLSYTVQDGDTLQLYLPIGGG
jgi:hypothetical protein